MPRAILDLSDFVRCYHCKRPKRWQTAKYIKGHYYCTAACFNEAHHDPAKTTPPRRK